MSIAVSTIASVLIGRFLSLNAVAAFFLMSTAVWVATVVNEWRELRRSSRNWKIGWSPLGGRALALAIAWIVVVVLSLVDIQSGHKLFINVAMLDQSSRINWTESVLRTGVPPANPMYWYEHSAPMRNYYFWYILCAAIARTAQLPVRAITVAGCVWSGFSLAALVGLYLKHFIKVGTRLRQQFLTSVGLLLVSGLDVCVVLWNLFHDHMGPPTDLDLWSKDPIFSWLNTTLWVPHHLASLLCCMFAFLIAWMTGKNGAREKIASAIVIAASLASAFGLSVHVAFAFFLVMLLWGLWQAIFERIYRPAMLLAVGGACAVILLLPYLWEMTRGSSGMHGRIVLGFAVREMLPPGGLIQWPFLQRMATDAPTAVRNIANVILLAPGYAIELGFFIVALLIYIFPAWRGRTPLAPAPRSLVFIAVATLPIISFIRSYATPYNDFGFRGALLVQFSLLLLGSEVISSWEITKRDLSESVDCVGMPKNTPQWLRSMTAVTLVIGVASTLCQGLIMRFIAPLGEWHASSDYDPKARSFSHNAYISSIGYRQLDAAISQDAVVQFNPNQREPFWRAADEGGVNHQTAIASDQPWCGSELGGDPSGCIVMAAAIDAIYKGATAEQARATCKKFGIQYLVARIYDSAWQDKSDWIWTLKPVVSENEFRALDCRQ